ncbi:MAG: hypothetical protein FWB74_04805 [Defluviitaleaceae bacterium]|nr:hypothetical protein [Defluviitaleaceae bacterium]
MNKSVFGLNENWAAALAYFFGFISGIPILIMERENKFVRFAALQSTIFTLVMTLIMAVFRFLSDFLPLIGWIFGMVGWVIGVCVFIVWAYLIFMAWRGQIVKLPILGDTCWEQVDK